MVQYICNPCVVMGMLLESSCLGMGGSKLEGVPTKILSRATLILLAKINTKLEIFYGYLPRGHLT